MMNLLQRFQDHLAATGLLATDDRLLVAVSGGLDSVVLLDLLTKSHFELAIAHCNFQLRAEASEADAKFVEGLATHYGFPCYTKTFDTKAHAQANGLSTQMAARELRYEWFEELLAQEGYDYVLTAHHFDDNLETLLLHFLRGTGLRGLAGIPPQRDIYRRPLLFASRADLVTYQKAARLPFREDESNARDDYQRNYLRHHVLPHLYHLQPALNKIGPANFSHLQATKALLDQQLDELYVRYLKRDANDMSYLDRESLEAHPQVDMLLWEWLSPYGFTADQIRQLRESEFGTVLHAKQYAILVTEKGWYLDQKATVDADWSASWPANEDRIKLPDGQTIELRITTAPPSNLSSTTPQAVFVPHKALQFPLTVRYRRAGDEFCPFGMGGKHQKLKDFFIKQKINRWQRARTPILVNGDGRIIWVVGCRLDERFRLMSPDDKPVKFVTSGTKKAYPDDKVV